MQVKSEIPEEARQELVTKLHFAAHNLIQRLIKQKWTLIEFA